MSVKASFPRSITFLLAMTLVLGVAYPALITGVALIAFPKQARGSLISLADPKAGGQSKVMGSELFAQKVESPRFFRARPSASDYAYVGAAASNLGPDSQALAKSVADNKAAWAKSFTSPAPQEMLYDSASGLDPDISLETALAQLPGVAAARGLDQTAQTALEAEVRKAAASATTIISGPTVNVTRLNKVLESDARFAGSGR